jgi:YbbR domain-containing protein
MAQRPGWPWIRALLVSSVRDNWPYKLLTLLGSVIVWGWIQSEQVVEESAWVRVEYATAEHLVLAQTPTQRVRVTVSGARSTIRALHRSQDRLRLNVDMTDLQAGVQNVDFVDGQIENLSDRLTVVGLVPNSVQVELQPRTTKVVELEAATVGSPPKGFRVVGITLEPDRVELSGPQSALRDLERVQTEGIPIKGLTETSTIEVGVVLQDRGVELEEATSVLATVEIEATSGTRTFAEVPVVSRNPAWRAAQQTVQVELRGPGTLLRKLSADQVTAMVLVPSTAELEQITVGLDPDAAARVQINQPLGPEIETLSITPARFTVEPITP